MAKSTYLQLVSQMITETGLNAGNPPATIAEAAGQSAKVAYWIKEADVQLQLERIDWRFLWLNPTVNLTAGSRVIPAPSINSTPTNTGQSSTGTYVINRLARDRLAVIDGNGNAHFPCWMDWNEFSTLYNFETQVASDYPAYFTQRPDRVIMLSEPISSGGITCKYEGWRKPVRLSAGTDVSAIPEEHERLIIVKAKIMYAEHEDAPEVMAGSGAEYDVELNKMLSMETMEGDWQRLEQNDALLTVSTE